MGEKLAALKELIEKHRIEYFNKHYPHYPPDCLTKETTVHIKPGLKYIKVDVGESGKYMVEASTGDIYGIKAYGVIHRGHHYGNLDTINEYFWGDYTAQRRVTP
jgi:hypothetical protein